MRNFCFCGNAGCGRYRYFERRKKMFLDQIKEFLLTNWKTTVTGLVLGLAGIAKTYGIVVEESTLNWVIAHIVPVGVIFLGIFAKDTSK